MMRALLGLALAAALLVSRDASAGPWLREPGRFYVNTGYARISTSRFFAPDFSVIKIVPYTQHLWTFYGELGVAPWLMLSIEGTALRSAALEGLGRTLGSGDWRFGAWTKIPVPKVKLAFATIVGVPFGDSHPRAGAGASPDAEAVANSLPTGDGETDVEFKLSFGHSFGGARRWPVQHYVVIEAGYWLHTKFHDAFTWRAELGTRFPWKFVDRFWISLRLTGVESFASNAEAGLNATGLGDGVDKSRAGFRIVIDHLALEGVAPRRFVRPFGIANEAPVAIAVQTRAIASIGLRDELGSAAPRLAELLFLAWVDAPPIDRDEHAFLLRYASDMLSGHAQKGSCCFNRAAASHSHDRACRAVDRYRQVLALRNRRQPCRARESRHRRCSALMATKQVRASRAKRGFGPVW